MGNQLLATITSYFVLYSIILFIGRLEDVKNSIKGKRHLLKVAIRLAIVFLIAATPCVLLGAHPLLIIALLLVLPLATIGLFGETLLGLPTLLIYCWITMKPNTSIISNLTHQNETISTANQSISTHHNSEIAGTIGKTITALRPYGEIRIGDKRFEAKAKGGLIQANMTVLVLREENSVLVVEETTRQQ